MIEEIEACIRFKNSSFLLEKYKTFNNLSKQLSSKMFQSENISELSSSYLYSHLILLLFSVLNFSIGGAVISVLLILNTLWAHNKLIFWSLLEHKNFLGHFFAKSDDYMFLKLNDVNKLILTPKTIIKQGDIIKICSDTPIIFDGIVFEGSVVYKGKTYVQGDVIISKGFIESGDAKLLILKSGDQAHFYKKFNAIYRNSFNEWVVGLGADFSKLGRICAWLAGLILTLRLAFLDHELKLSMETGLLLAKYLTSILVMFLPNSLFWILTQNSDTQDVLVDLNCIMENPYCIKKVILGSKVYSSEEILNGNVDIKYLFENIKVNCKENGGAYTEKALIKWINLEKIDNLTKFVSRYEIENKKKRAFLKDKVMSIGDILNIIEESSFVIEEGVKREIDKEKIINRIGQMEKIDKALGFGMGIEGETIFLGGVFFEVNEGIIKQEIKFLEKECGNFHLVSDIPIRDIFKLIGYKIDLIVYDDQTKYSEVEFLEGNYVLNRDLCDEFIDNLNMSGKKTTFLNQNKNKYDKEEDALFVINHWEELQKLMLKGKLLKPFYEKYVKWKFIWAALLFALHIIYFNVGLNELMRVFYLLLIGYIPELFLFGAIVYRFSKLRSHCKLDYSSIILEIAFAMLKTLVSIVIVILLK